MATRFHLKEHVFAHRGLWGGDVPENSLLAFQRAAQAGFGAECDVHLSADGVPMVFHDFTLDRLTGHSAATRDLTCEALQNLTLNQSTETIPTLSDILAAMGDLPVLVELKSDATTNAAALGRAVADLVATHKGPLAIMSFDPAVVHAVRQHNTSVLLGFLLNPREDWSEARLSKTLGDTKIDFLGPNIKDLTQASLLAEQLRLELACWTVRSEAEFSAVIAQKGAPIFENLTIPLVRTLSIP